MSPALRPTLLQPPVSFETELPEGIESWGPFDPPNLANLPPPIRPGSPTTIKIKRELWNHYWKPRYSASERERIREGKKPEMVRRRTISGDDPATCQTKSRLPSIPFLRRAKTNFAGSDKKDRSTANDATNTDDFPPPLDTDRGSDREDSRPSSSGSEKTERRFSIFKRTNKISVPVARPQVNQRIRLNRTRTADTNYTSGTSFDDSFSFARALNELLRPSSNETTASGTDTETSSPPLDPSPRTSLFWPSPKAQVPKEPEPQWLPMGSAMVAWTSVPRSSTWLEDLERHLDSSQKVVQSLPRETQSAISELREHQTSRKPGREVYFVERPGKVFDLRTWDGTEPVDEDENEESPESTNVAEEDEVNGRTERPAGLRQRMDSACASISKSIQRLVGRRSSSSTSE